MTSHSGFPARLGRSAVDSLVVRQVDCLNVFFECGCRQGSGYTEHHGAGNKNGHWIECNGQ